MWRTKRSTERWNPQSALSTWIQQLPEWKNRARFIHEHPHWIQLTGREIKEQLGDGDDIGMDVWTGIWRLLRQLETKIYRGSYLRWSHIFEPQFTEELMDDVVDFVYLEIMMTPEYLGYNLKFVKNLMLPGHLYESWSLCVVDVDNKHMMVMDRRKHQSLGMRSRLSTRLTLPM